MKGGTLLISHLVLVACLVIHVSASHSSNPKEELREIQKKLSMEKLKLKKTLKREKSILDDLEDINRTLAKKKKELDFYDAKLSESRSGIRLLENEITVFGRKLDARKKLLSERLRSLYKQQRGDIAILLVSARDHQDLIRRIRYLRDVAYYDNTLMRTYSEEIGELNVKIARLEILQQEYELSKINIERKAKELRGERDKKDLLLASIKNERSSYSRMIDELQRSSEKLQEIIKELEKQTIVPSGKGGGFGRMQGRLPWPINGKVIVPFGRHNDPQMNIPTFKRGVEIGANIGNTVLAVAGGRVVYADWFKGYGQLLIINHGGGYHTLYAHLSEIFHKTGDIIKSRQAIGKIGESGLSNVPSLYFEIRHKGKPVDPGTWLRSRKK